MKIAGLQKVTLIDFPDRVAASVFLAGCNLDCGYCHNRWMIREARVEEAISREELLAWLGTRVGLLDGVCVSGGEPTIHRDIQDLLAGIRALGFAVKLDTNGTRPEVLDRLLADQLVDYVAMDIKAPLDAASYRRAAGVAVAIEDIRNSMRLLREKAPEYEFRTTVEPALDQDALARIASEMLPEDQWYLQPFVPAPGIAEEIVALGFLDEAELRAVVAPLRTIAPGVQLRGG